MSKYEIVVDSSRQKLKLIQQALDLRWIEFEPPLTVEEAEDMQTISTAEVEDPLPESLGYPSYPLLGAWVDDGDADGGSSV